MSKLNIISPSFSFGRIGRIFVAFLFLAFFISPINIYASEKDQEESLNVKDIIFEHLGDGYGWEIPFSHTDRMPLPVIVRSKDHKWFCFSSADLTRKVDVTDPKTGKSHHVVEPVIKSIDKDGKTYRFVLAHISTNKDKVVEIFEPNLSEEKILSQRLQDVDKTGAQDFGSQVIDGFVYQDGKYYSEYRPLDLSVTKNVAALFIAIVIVLGLVFWLISYYRRHSVDMKAPRKGLGFFEMLIGFVYYDTIKATLGIKTKKFAPYLLTVFFFILVMNLVGLIVVFPGGANLTGNIAITLVLAICTFVMTNLFGTKHYWKEIFWPEVPLFLKFPLPIMQLIEVFGIFTKPAALCVRLFANMMGGHMIVITLTLLIFILGVFGAAVTGMTTVVSVLFSIFMLVLDVLVSFIQAYVFTLLSALFISLAQVDEEEHHAKADIDNPALEHEDIEKIQKQKELVSKEAANIDLA